MTKKDKAEVQQASESGDAAATQGGEYGDLKATDTTDFGTVQIHNNVIAVIARIAALKVPGVVDLSGSLVDGLADMIGKKSRDRGIRVDVDEAGVDLQLHVVIAYGVRIPQVAWRLQNDVRQAVEQMTGKPVKNLNIIVQGVTMPGDNADVDDEGLIQ